MARVVSFLLALSVAAIAGAVASANPVVPAGYTALFNVTVYDTQSPKGANFLMTAYQGYNSTLSTTFAPIAFPYALKRGGDQTSVKYNPALQTCLVTCKGGSMCAGGSCSVDGSGPFGPLAAAKPNGTCALVPTGQQYRVITHSDATTEIEVTYCFDGNKPIYGIEKVNVVSGAPRELPVHIAKKRPFYNVAPSLTVEMVVYLMGVWTPVTPSEAVFGVPKFCQCSDV